MEAYEARVNITYKGQNGDLPDPVNYEATNGDVLGWAAEAIRGGGVPGINADLNANLVDFVVDRFPSDAATPYNRLMIRPKTPFGDLVYTPAPDLRTPQQKADDAELSAYYDQVDSEEQDRWLELE